jgi:hypothetical protein
VLRCTHDCALWTVHVSKGSSTVLLQLLFESWISFCRSGGVESTAAVHCRLSCHTALQAVMSLAGALAFTMCVLLRGMLCC